MSETIEQMEREHIKSMFTEDSQLFPKYTEMRTFDTGATRSPLGDKLQYEGYLSPLVLQRYAEYMKQHQTQADGTQRAADNWQKGIPRESLMDSLMRHTMDAWLHHRGCSDRAMESMQEALCAMMFNVMALLKHELEGDK